MAALLPDDLIELGQVQDAQGLQGEIKVRPFSSDPVALLASKSVWLSLRPHLATDAVGTKLPNSVFAPQEYRVIKAKYHSGLVVLHLEGVTDRDARAVVDGWFVNVTGGVGSSRYAAHKDRSLGLNQNVVGIAVGHRSHIDQVHIGTTHNG